MTSIPTTAEVVAGAQAQAVWERAASDVVDGPLPSCAVHVRRGDEVLLDAVVGAPPDARWLGYSTAKPVTAIVAVGLVARGALDLDERVAEILPWFTGDGLDDIRVEHLLLHTAGIARAPMRAAEGADPARRRRRMATWHTTSTPGDRFGYHATSAHWVLTTLIEEITGADLPSLVAATIAEPLGLRDFSLGGEPDDPRFQAPIAVGDPTPADVLANLLDAGIDLEAMVGEAATEHLAQVAEPDVLRSGHPSAGLVTSARDLAGFLAGLLRPGDTVLPDRWRQDVIGNVRNRLPDPGLGMPANRTLAFVVAGDDGNASRRELPSSLGSRVFGHSGAGGQIAWADPDTGLVFAHVTNGLHHDPLWSWARSAELNELAAACA